MMSNATLAPHVIDALARESLLVQERQCRQVRLPTRACGRCVASCPSQAISIQDRGITVDASHCERCGICSSACPEGVFCLSENDDGTWIGRMARERESWENQVFFHCPTSRAKRGYALPCLSRLTETMMLAPLVLGATDVTLLSGDCKGCERERSIGAFCSVWREACAFADCLWKGNKHLTWEIPEENTAEAVATESVTRRNFLKTVGRKVAERTRSIWPSAGDRKPGELTALLSYYEGTRGDDVILRGVHRLGRPALDKSRCTACGACVEVCPHRALTATENADRGEFCISHLAKDCSGCRNCVAVCRERALTWLSPISLRDLVQDEPSPCGTVKIERCGECRGRADTTSDGQPLCAPCFTHKKRRGISA